MYPISTPSRRTTTIVRTSVERNIKPHLTQKVSDLDLLTSDFERERRPNRWFFWRRSSSTYREEHCGTVDNLLGLDRDFHGILTYALFICLTAS